MTAARDQASASMDKEVVFRAGAAFPERRSTGRWKSVGEVRDSVSGECQPAASTVASATRQYSETSSAPAMQRTCGGDGTQVLRSSLLM